MTTRESIVWRPVPSPFPAVPTSGNHHTKSPYIERMTSPRFIDFLEGGSHRHGTTCAAAQDGVDHNQSCFIFMRRLNWQEPWHPRTSFRSSETTTAFFKLRNVFMWWMFLWWLDYIAYNASPVAVRTSLWDGAVLAGLNAMNVASEMVNWSHILSCFRESMWRRYHTPASIDQLWRMQRPHRLTTQFENAIEYAKIT